MDEDWSASVEADEGEDGLFVPVLVITPPDREVTRLPLAGVYRTNEEAIDAGR